MITPTYNLSGKVATSVSLDKKLFDVKTDPVLLALAVRVYLSNQRSASAHTKTRAQVAGSTRKLFKQKGTGRARHGSIRAPIFVGGGIAHGPDGLQNYAKKLPTQMAKQAIVGALSKMAKLKNISIVKGANEATGKTKQMESLLNSLAPKGRVLMVATPEQTKFRLACRNIKRSIVATTSSLNAYQILTYPKVILTAEAVSALEKKYVA